jgi:hypothetical protein
MDENAGVPTDGNQDGRYPYNSGSKGFPVEDIGVATVDYQVNWPVPTDPNNPYAVEFLCLAKLHEHGEVKAVVRRPVTVQDGQPVDIKIELSNQDTLEAPEHAWITIRITNNRMA